MSFLLAKRLPLTRHGPTCVSCNNRAYPAVAILNKCTNGSVRTYLRLAVSCLARLVLAFAR